MKVAVVIPTIKGREASLQRTIDGYLRTMDAVELIVVRDKATCGIAWNQGVREAEAEFIHLSADDIVPHEGWLEAAMISMAAEQLPAGRILHGDGTLQSCGDELDRPDGFVTEIPRIPFLPAWLALKIFPIPPIHYYTDNIVGDRARGFGWPTIVNRGYLFTHHLVGEGRLDDRLASDGRRYTNQGVS